MEINGLGSPVPSVGAAGVHRAGGAAPQSQSVSQLVNQIAQQEQRAGGGGHGGGHGAKKTALDAIDDIAARSALKIQPRGKSVLDRMREIDEMQEAQAEQDERVGEKDPEARDGSREDDEPGDDGTAGEERPAS
jgi:hypothetical protein